MVAGLVLLVMGVTLSTGTASARQSDPAEPADDPGLVRVVKVSGLLDPVLVSFLQDEIESAQQAGITALVLQLNSDGAAVSDDDLDDLVEDIRDSSVLIGVWVGPSGSKAEEEATRLVAAADVSGLPQGSRIEVTSELVGDTDLEGKTSVGETVGSELANQLGLVDSPAPIIGEFILDLPDVQSEIVDGARQPVTPVRFGQLGLIDQLFHTVASPAVAYLLFVIGLALLLFELYTAGVGVAGVVGAGSLVLGCYGLAALPTRPLGVALLLFAMFGYGVDIQTGVPRVWTGIGTVSFVLGSLLLYDGLSVSWVTLLVSFVGMTLAMLAGMPTMVRTRFSTPTIGREWMIGEMGEARTDVDPDGLVEVRHAPWRARTNRATPIRQRDRIRVVAIDGLVLEVEPEVGGARDYRERHRTGD